MGPNQALIGIPGSRERLSTPALLVDIDALDRNIARMANYARGHGCRLRPHAKAHKCVEVAARQVAAGAAGIACTTLGEAAVMVDAGIRAVLVTSPMIAPAAIARLMALNGRAENLVAVTDTDDNANALSAAARAAGKPLARLVDLDTGLERTGATSVDAAVGLVRRAAELPGLEFKGIQGYHGHLQHLPRYDERETKALAQVARVRALRDRLADFGLACETVTGGGTGTFEIDGGEAVYTELQPGSYLFMDVEYAPVDLTADAAQPFENALFVQATVVNDLHPGHVTITPE